MLPLVVMEPGTQTLIYFGGINAGSRRRWTEQHMLKITHQQTPAEDQFATYEARCTLHIPPHSCAATATFS